MWSQFTNVTDRQRDRQTTCDGNTALCTKVHRVVIKSGVYNHEYGKWLNYTGPGIYILPSGLLQLASVYVTDNVMRRVQSLQNAAARLITGARRRDHITPVLCQLHWLPVWWRVEFKLACLERQALCGQMPIYLADDIHLVSEGNRRSLRSSSDNMCAVPRMHNSFGDRSFGAVGPWIWNCLPRGLRTLNISYRHFKVLLQTYMFQQGHGALWHSI